MAEMGLNELRLGILCRGTVFQRWQAEAIRQALAVPGIVPVLLVTEEPAVATKRSRTWRHWDTALYRWYRRRFAPPAMQEEDLHDLLGDLPCVQVRPEQQGIRESFTKDQCAAIAGHRPDVLLRFGFNILTGDILSLPRFGVWSFHHGDPARYRGGPPGLWEIMDGEPVTGAVLQRLTEELDQGRILRQGWFATVDHSHAETVQTVLMHSAIWPAQVMRTLLAGDTTASDGVPPAGRGKLTRYPHTASLLRFLWSMAVNKLRFHRRDLREHEEWNIGVLNRPITDLLADDPPLNVRWLPPPAQGTFRADPFGYLDDQGRLNMLYEKFDHATGKGEIARLRPKQDNVIKRSRTMLDGDTHFSYPYVVKHEGAIWVVPENAASGRVDLYRVNETNDGLDLVGTLLDEALCDPTIFQHDGRWWLFGTKAPLTNVALYAYWSEHFEGPYHPHLLQPVKMDIRSARPAGTPFLRGGELWRPAQDSSVTYGGRIAFNRVVELDPIRFREETVYHLGPLKGSAYGAGLHTLCAMDGITLLDGKRFTRVPERAKAARERKLGKLKRRRR